MHNLGPARPFTDRLVPITNEPAPLRGLTLSNGLLLGLEEGSTRLVGRVGMNPTNQSGNGWACIDSHGSPSPLVSVAACSQLVGTKMVHKVGKSTC